MADLELSSLAETTTLADSDEFYVNDGGVSKKILSSNMGTQLVTTASVGAAIVAADAKATPIDADSIALIDSADSNTLKETTIAQLRPVIVNANSVATAAIQDNAVTLAKQEHGTQGDVLYYGASGAPARLAAGSDGDVLTSGGAGADPTFETPATPALSVPYASTGQTITSGGLLTLGHSLGSEPKIIQYILQCTSDEDGYSVGDRVFANYNNSDDSVGTYDNPEVDSTNIRIRFSDKTTCFKINHKTTGDKASLTNSNWKLYVRAYA